MEREKKFEREHQKRLLHRAKFRHTKTRPPRRVWFGEEGSFEWSPVSTPGKDEEETKNGV